MVHSSRGTDIWKTSIGTYRIYKDIDIRNMDDSAIITIDEQRLLDMDDIGSQMGFIPPAWNIGGSIIGDSPLHLEYCANLSLIFQLVGDSLQAAMIKDANMRSSCKDITFNIHSNWILLPIEMNALQDIYGCCMNMQHIYTKSYASILTAYPTRHLLSGMGTYPDESVFKMKYGDHYATAMVAMSAQIPHLEYSIRTGMDHEPYMLMGTLYSTILNHVLRDGIKYFGSVGIPPETVLMQFFGNYLPIVPDTDNVRLYNIPGVVIRYEKDGEIVSDSIETRIYSDEEVFNQNIVRRGENIRCLTTYQRDQKRRR